MKKELQNKLFNKYPKIFAQKDLSIRESCMPWGIECGDGWFWLIDQLCSSIECHLKNCEFNKMRVPQVEATQVKEKFGGLCFYYQGGDNVIEGMVTMAENMSCSICERCGSTEEVIQTTGWITTLCKKCYQKRQQEV